MQVGSVLLDMEHLPTLDVEAALVVSLRVLTILTFSKCNCFCEMINGFT